MQKLPRPVGAWAVALFAATWLTGCGSDETAQTVASNADVAGTWTETVVLDPGKDMSNQIKQAMAEATNITLDVHEDGTFTMTVAGKVSTGRWALAGNQMTLTYENVTGLVLGDGKSAALTLSGDRGSLESAPSPSGSKRKFTKK